MKLLFMLLLALQHSHVFQVPSTWNTKNGQRSLDHVPTVAEKMALWNAGSSELPNDFLTWHFTHLIQGDTRGAWNATDCWATNADPLRVVEFEGGGSSFFMTEPGPDGPWNQLRIPDSCNPPTANDGLAQIYNHDDPDHIWLFYQLRKYTSNCPNGENVCWTMANVRRFARTKAQAAEDAASGRPTGRGMGVDPEYVPNSGAQGACHASATYAHGIVHKEDLDQGELKHGIGIIIFTERVEDHAKNYPCKVPWSTTYPVPPGTPGRNAADMGERLVLKPDIDIDALDIGPDAKTILKGIQTYFYTPVDSTGEAVSSFVVENNALAGRDFRIIGSTFPNLGAFTDWLFTNSREIPCQPAFPGECGGADPPADFPPSTTTPPPPPPPAPPVTITMNPVRPVAGQSVTVTISDGPVKPLDWASIFAQDQLDTDFAATPWKYFTNTQVGSDVGIRPATLTFTAPATGTWDLRVFSDDSYTRMGTLTFAVDSPAPPDPCVTNPLRVTVSQWPSTASGGSRITYNTSVGEARTEWLAGPPPTFRVTDIRGCIVNVTR